MTATLISLPLSQLRESAHNPRRHIDAGLLQELADNIRQVGILTPLLVRPSGDGYEIAGGHRRFRAAGLAGFSEVPCIVRDLTDLEFLELLTLDNLHRADVHPLDEAEGYRALMDQAQYDVATIAAKVGKSESYIYQRLKLVDLVPPAKEAFLRDEITAGHAILLARLGETTQMEMLDECLNDYNPLSVRLLAQKIQRHVYLRLKNVPFPTEDATLPGGSCLECPKRSGYNKQLFPDIEEDDTCTDRSCHDAKVEAWLEEQYLSATNKGKTVVRLIAGHTYQQRKDARKDWQRAGKSKCADTVTGIVVVGGYHDTHEYKLGQTLAVCVNKKCTVHNVRAIAAREEQKAYREERSAERSAEQQAKEVALKAVAASIRARTDVPDAAWRRIGELLVERAYFRCRDMAVALDVTFDENADLEEVLVAHLMSLSGPGLRQAVLILLATEIRSSAETPSPTEQAFLDEYLQTSAKPKKKTKGAA